MKPPINQQDQISQEDKTMILESKRFGKMEVSEDRILHLEGGLLGFPNYERFILVDDLEDPTLPFKWLISVDNAEYAFLVTDPGIFFKDYVFDLSEEHLKQLDIQREDDVSVVTLLTVPSDPKMITANLRGPIVFNIRTLRGTQLVLTETDFATKHYIFLEATNPSRDEAQAEAQAAAGAFAAAAEELATGKTANTEVNRNS